MFSSVREEQRGYIDGLLVVSIIFSVFFLIWAFILVVLKCKGKEVGCASGRAFVNTCPEDDESSETDIEKTQNDDFASTSVSSSDESCSVSSSKPLFSEHGDTVMGCFSSDFSSDDNESDEVSPDVTKANRRERRTRLVFILFASIALICAPLTLFLTFSPLKEVVTQSSDNLILVCDNNNYTIVQKLTITTQFSISVISHDCSNCYYLIL